MTASETTIHVYKTPYLFPKTISMIPLERLKVVFQKRFPPLERPSFDLSKEVVSHRRILQRRDYTLASAVSLGPNYPTC